MINDSQVSEQQVVNKVISELMTSPVEILNPPQGNQTWLREYNDLVACAEVSRRMVELARRVAVSECTVLLSGESGTGKEVLARFIHCNSPRADQPFIAINCAAIPENMLEAMLFGYERGAFTGAHAAHAGKFEQANCGTLLLDEVSEMPLGLQAKLLRVLQEREVERIGSRHPIALDVRVLATTNRSLRAEVAAGRFREDLYYRLNVFPLLLSPLRDRRDDVLPLAMRILNLRSKPGDRIPAISADAAHCLLTYPWPGNVRELDNVIQRALILSNGPVIEREHIQFETELQTGQPAQSIRKEAAPLSDSLETAERVLIMDALRAGHGSRREVAEKLGISQRTLRYKLARLREAGVDVPAA
ncbi:MAG TPA: sigma-54 dependent transcriptional regulator [Steroidobacteraceae bacterium]|jgi:two-component system response regulator FlrC|nr:sigma-54 dependent transcriptional regulator [Steroidobacteraceae bacterium]